MPLAIAFPRSFPEGSVKQVLDYYSGKNMDKWVAAEGAYDVLGYALYKASSGPQPVAGLPNNQQIVRELQMMMDEYKSKNSSPPPQQQFQTKDDEDFVPPPMGVIDVNAPGWLLPFILQMLMRLVTT